MKLKNPFTKADQTRADSDAKRAIVRGVATGSLDFVKRVWDAPVDFNRATRRSVGLTGRIWRWNPGAPMELPRYARRHAEAAVLTPHTRRQRRHRARIMRDLKQRGLV